MNEFDPKNLPENVKGVVMEVGPDGLSPATMMSLFENLIHPAIEECGPFGAPVAASSIVQMAALGLYITMTQAAPSSMRDGIGEEFSPKAFLTSMAEAAPDHEELSGKIGSILEAITAGLNPLDPKNSDAVIEGLERMLAGEAPEAIIEDQAEKDRLAGEVEAERYNARLEERRLEEAEYEATQETASAEDESTVDDPEGDEDAHEA